MPGYVVQEHAQSSPDPDSDGRTTSENLTADCRRPGTLSICVARSVHCAHLSGLCVCRAHLSICVDSRAPQAARPGCGSGRITGITRSSAPRPLSAPAHRVEIVIPSQTHHFVIPSASSDARANHQLYISPWWNPEKISQNENSCRFHFSDSPGNCLLLVLD